MRLVAPLFALLAAGLALPAMNCTPAPYPTDQCVKLKLDAAADLCEASMAGSTPPGASAQFVTAWAAAEAIAQSRGVDCSESTATDLNLAALILQGAALVRDQVTASLTGPAACTDELFAAAGRFCRDRIAARGSHLVKRDRDRDRALLDRDLDRARDAHADAVADAASDLGCGGTNLFGTESAISSLSQDVHEAATIAPGVPQAWTAVVPDGPVQYGARAWDAACWDGGPYRFFVKKGTVNKVLVNYEGGGACWDVFTCGLNPTFKQSVAVDGHPGNFPFGFADDTNPGNPFRDWHKVYVPYCTGDIHWGDATVDHQQLGSGGQVVNEVTVRHQGFSNTRVVEKWLREHFVDPEMVFVTGSSAGAYGAIGNSVWLMEKVFPSTEFAVLGDAGNGVVTQQFLADEISKWGVETLLPDWIPALNVPIDELSAADLYAEVAKTYPNNRFGTFTYAFDGGQGGQTGFYHVMLNPGAIFLWPNWWNSTCAWNSGMTALNASTVERAPNYRFYVGAGASHTTFFRDRVYTQTTGGVPTVASWVQAMVDDTSEWTNEECSDCGILHPDDPRPNPLVVPYTFDNRIDCSGVGGP